MIRSYTDHAANERTFLSWIRTGLSAVALGIVVKKGSLVALVIAGAASAGIAPVAQDALGEYGGAFLVAIGITTIIAAFFRFARTALRIDDQEVHSAGIVRLASALLRREGDAPARRINLRLVGGIDVPEAHRKST
jgi:putative membrane protein